MKKNNVLKSFTLILLFMPLVSFSQKRDIGEEQKRSKQNEKIALNSKMQCSTENANAKLFMNPSISSDSYDGTIGGSWTFIVHKTEIIGGKKYLKGHMVSPRGGHQPDVGYIDPTLWACTKVN
jgi:hypothetical protein